MRETVDECISPMIKLSCNCIQLRCTRIDIVLHFADVRLQLFDMLLEIRQLRNEAELEQLQLRNNNNNIQKERIVVDAPHHNRKPVYGDSSIMKKTNAITSSSSSHSSTPSSTAAPISVAIEQQAEAHVRSQMTQSLRGRATGPWTAGPPKFKCLKERCEALLGVVSGALGGMTSAFQAKACKCLGCCKPYECFYNIMEDVDSP